MKNSNNIYLKNNFYKEAIEKYSDITKTIISYETIEVSSKECNGYILSEPVFANVSSPNFTASAMDGVAVNYEKTLDATEVNHITLIKNIDYIEVDTGDYIPPNYNAVIMVENIIKVNHKEIKITSPAGFYENIRSVGEDIVKAQMILPRFHKIRPVDVGAIIGGGVEYVKVVKPFKIGIMPTGTEIVDVSKKIFEKGDIIDSNSHMLKALVEEMGFQATINEVIKDDYDLLKENITNLTQENDIVFINAGSSSGRKDFTKDILEELGEVVVHGIAIKPGKPVIMAIVNKKIVIGIPGYPVSCYIIFEKVIKPILNKLIKQTGEETNIQCFLTKNVYSSLKHLEFVRVKVGIVNDKWVATPLARGAGISMSLVECDGILEVPKELEGYSQGEKVTIKLNKSNEVLKNKIVSIGSHDILLDIIKDLMIKENSLINLSSSNIGSMGGILALKNKECLMAPIHIFDRVTKNYNIAIVKKIFKNEEMVLIKGVKRLQGLIVQKGNPKNINSIKDIINYKYCNRQKSSGTYLLFESLLKDNDIRKESISGFDFYVPTHFDVAVNVKENIVDCGLGIYSVAKVLELDFIKVAEEEYDFLIYKKDLNKEHIQQFISILKLDDLRAQLEDVGGYDCIDIGKVIVIK